LLAGIIVELLISRRPIDDTEVKTLLELDETITNVFGNGVLEDIVPYLKDIYPTARWNKLVDTMNGILDILRAKFKQHVDTFQPGENVNISYNFFGSFIPEFLSYQNR
jgi:hypothetical protein